MVRIARERISTLFVLAEREATTGHSDLADRYVTLARRIGMRYNIRLLPEYRELYCRGCSSFWVEGRTVRTRLRSGRRVRTCLKCGRERRVLIHGPRVVPGAGPSTRLPGAARDEAVLVSGPLDEEEPESPGEESEEE
jgi:ribonuclease P protein subunit RPR2